MSTTASPRPSTALSSRRTSTDSAVPSPSTSRPPPPATQRRNRVALRDYYGLKSAAPAEGNTSEQSLPKDESTPESELDKPDFNAEQYVKDTLGKEGLEGVLRVEAGLKFAGLTANGKPWYAHQHGSLDPATSTLTPAISHIAETAQQLSSSLKQLVPDMPREDPKRKQRQTVRWVLGAPSRLRRLRSEGKVEEAQKDLEEVSKLLEKWKGVQGVEEVKKECEEIMQDDG
ncbi:hypothetical protein H2203_005540 [Taxawa tesnikishii (nom. ined.)]|nr:hypothetical protein H2203_005540 [Dothideales sp. JES 119]